MIALAAAGFVVASLLDRWAYTSLWAKHAEFRDWARALRSLGYWPTWVAVSAIFILIDRRGTYAPNAWPIRDRWTRGVLLVVSTGLAGVLAEVLKLVIRRERPELSDGVYAFREYSKGLFDTGGLGLPSSHTAVAFAAAIVIARFHPPAAPVLLMAAVGCGLTRVLDRAHYVSDAYGGALVGWAVVAVIWALHARNARRSAEPATMPQ